MRTSDVSGTEGDPDVTVLCIDDNIANLRLIERVLALRPSTRVISALDAATALDLAREHLPHLVLLDVQLPRVGGEDILRRLRADPRTSSIPVVVVSADATSATGERFHALGAQAYLTKPVDVEQLLEVVDSHAAMTDPPNDARETPPGVRERRVEDDVLSEDTLGMLGRVHDEGTKGDAHDLVRLFADSSKRHVSDLRAAVSRGDAPAVQTIAHALNGLASTFGSQLVPERCLRLEKLASLSDLTGAEALVGEIASELERVYSALEARFGSGAD